MFADSFCELIYTFNCLVWEAVVKFGESFYKTSTKNEGSSASMKLFYSGKISKIGICFPIKSILAQW